MLKNKQAYTLLFLFIAIFALITFKGLKTLQPGDENVYYYMGKLVSEGEVPYKDFFFAHPPLQIYLLALAYKIFGFNIVVLKSIPLISTFITAFFIFKIAQKKLGNVEAILSSSLFLFSYGIMFNSVFSFGIELAAMFLIIGIYFLSNQNNYWLAGLFFGLAGTMRLLSLVPIFVIFASALLLNKKNFLKLSSSFLIIFLLVNGAFAMIAGNNYSTYVYKYHFQKTFGGKENLKEYIDIIKLNWILFLSAFLFIFAKDKKHLSLFAIISLVYLLFMISLKKIFGFYFLIAFPFLAIVGGCSIVKIYNSLNLSRKWKILILIVSFFVFGWNLASDFVFLEKIGFRGFERGEDLTDFINSISGEQTLLFGDDSVVPLLALLTDKKIALDFADTNNQVFISGIRDLNKILADLRSKDVLFIIRDMQGISYFKEVKEFLNENCDFLSQFHDKVEGNYLVYRCS